jgi:sugar lactone lactonase YvrE
VAAIAPSVFVAVEGLYDSLVFFDAEGRLLLNVGGPGSGPGEFWLPAGMAFDADRQLLFVADSYNSRVQVFRFLGADSAPDGDSKDGASP